MHRPAPAALGSPSSRSASSRPSWIDTASVNILEGDEALISVADMLYQTLRDDSRLEAYAKYCDLKNLAGSLHRFLSAVFPTSWPRMVISPAIIMDRYEDLLEVILEVIRRPVPLGEQPMELALAALSKDLRQDPRVESFIGNIRYIATAKPSRDSKGVNSASLDRVGASPSSSRQRSSASKKSEAIDEEEVRSRVSNHSRGGESDSQSAPLSGEPGLSGEEEAGDPESPVPDGQQGNAYGNDIVNTSSLDELHISDEQIEAVQRTWKMFLDNMETTEAAGDALYVVVVEAQQPALRSFFTSPRAVHANRLTQTFQSLVALLGDPAQLRMTTETLGFSHMQIDVDMDGVVRFRNSILDLLTVELAEEFTEVAKEGWAELLGYVGGAILFVREHYAERVRLLQQSWAQANKTGAAVGTRSQGESFGPGGAHASADFLGQRKAPGGGGSGSSMEKVAEKVGLGTTDGSHAQEHHEGQAIPKTYNEMFHFNAAVMGFGESAWQKEVLACFENIVLNIANSGRIQEECDVLSLRIAMCGSGIVNFSEYKSCMLASMRSLLPKTWSTAHEVAWKWLWETVEKLLQPNLGRPQKWRSILSKFMSKLDEDTLVQLRGDLYNHFFTTCATGQDFFKQSTTYLHLILSRVMNMVLEFYSEPVKLVDQISALGLRHAGYGITPEIVVPYVASHIAIVTKYCRGDPQVVEAYQWSLQLISKILSRTLVEGSTIVMKAINQNSYRGLQKAVGCAPRGDRNKWMLIVQVGTQNISPLAWALESGALEAAKAVLEDLLTFRADRERYYFGADELFQRHPDIVKMLLDNASQLLPVLLDGLIWRSRLTEGGMRRVNYYLKNLLCNSDGTPAHNLTWIVQSKDPKIVCHPMLVAMSDVVWKVARFPFLFAKVWLIGTLCIFMLSQSILARLADSTPAEIRRDVTFGCRAFIYSCSMTQLIYRHMRATVTAVKKKSFTRFCCIRVPSYLLEEWQEAASFSLMLSLVAMMIFEPILHCWTQAQREDHLFLQSCAGGEDVKFKYSMCGTLALMLYYMLLIDLTVFSNRISAYVLVAGRLGAELLLFLFALVSLVVAFASIVSVLDHVDEDFEGIHHGSTTFLEMAMRIVDADRFKEFFVEPWVALTIFMYLILVVILLSNQLVAQLTCAYTSIFTDMVGLARLGRMKIIVETLPRVSKKKWARFVDSLDLGKKLEFNKGDQGIAGGVQMREPANEHPTTVDIILRFGGSTSPAMRWPDSTSSSASEDDQFARLEKLVKRTLSRSHGRGGGSTGGSKMSGSSMGGSSLGSTYSSMGSH